MPTSFITGINGQDGSYLAEHLLKQGERVTGIVRRNSVPEHQSSRIYALEAAGKVETCYGDLTDPASLIAALKRFKPDYVYNLASQSHVRISFDVPKYTFEVNATGVLNMLDACRLVVPQARFYQASSSEQFGNVIDPDGYQRVTTPMHPVSPYGCAKLAAFHLVRHFRRAYEMHAVNGVLFNHGSPRRASNFVTAKVCKGAVEIAMGKRDKLPMGNLDSKRDWGHSWDYVRAMRLMLHHGQPGDWVIATGETRSVRDLLATAFGMVGLDYQDYVFQDEQYMRPDELHELRGDSSPARDILGWKPERTFDGMIREIIDHWKGVLGWSG